MNQLSITHFPALDYACDEAMNTLCTNLSYSGPGIRTVLFTSRYEQEGKSGITMNVMRTLAGYGKRVLLVDADLRRSTLARRYRFNYSQREAFGLVHYLAGMCALEEVVYQTNLPGAYILPAGRDVFNSMQLLTSPLYGEMMRAMRERFDMVLVDSPPPQGSLWTRWRSRNSATARSLWWATTGGAGRTSAWWPPTSPRQAARCWAR